MGEIWRYHVARTPDGPVHVHPIGVAQLPDDPTDRANRLSAIAADIRAEYGFPDDWYGTDGWDSGLHQGEPHHTIMTGATIHETYI